MKKLLFVLPVLLMLFVGCERSPKVTNNTTALDEQVETEKNQKNLFQKQPPPKIDWSMERDNLTKRFKMMNDRAVFFYMYVFIEGVQDPIGYYQVNKVSSVNSQLTNDMQVVAVPMTGGGYTYQVLPSPAEDGSYGTNGDGVFGFTPDDIYIEHNMKYIVSTVPLSFTKPVNRLTVISVETENQLKTLMDKINK
jgi:hypothetical protein